MSAPNASSSSQLVSYAQDVDYTRTEGFKQFKARYNVKNARAADQLPISAVLGSLPISHFAYSAPCL